MNETERDRILRMVSEGTLRPTEAAQLLAALADETPVVKPQVVAAVSEAEKEKEKEKQKPIEVQMQRGDGSHYTIELPAQLVPMIAKVTGVYIKEAAKSAANDAWDGFKIMMRNKTNEVKNNVTAKVKGVGDKPTPKLAAAPEATEQAEARRRILQMVQNGRISAGDASRLIEQLDAHTEFRKTHPEGAAS